MDNAVPEVIQSGIDMNQRMLELLERIISILDELVALTRENAYTPPARSPKIAPPPPAVKEISLEELNRRLDRLCLKDIDAYLTKKRGSPPSFSVYANTFSI